MTMPTDCSKSIISASTECTSSPSSSRSSLSSGSYTETTTSSNKKMMNKKQRKVQFFKKVKVRPTIHLTHFTEEEFQATWFQAEEYMQIRMDIRDIVQEMEATNAPISVENEEISIRGLEFRTKSGYAKRLRNKQEAMATVLDEQELQRHQGMEDPELVADLYKHCTKPSQMESSVHGLLDERAARQILVLVHSSSKQQTSDLQAPTQRQRSTKKSKTATIPLLSGATQTPSKQQRVLCAAA